MKKEKLIGKVNVHSIVDLITNSSTELFCTVTSKSEEIISTTLDEILVEMGCSGVEFTVDQSEDDDGNEIIGQFDISYDYECFHKPCKHILNMVKERFNIIDIEDE